MIDLLKQFTLTSKSVRLMRARKFKFNVDLRLTKPQIKSCRRIFSS